MAEQLPDRGKGGGKKRRGSRSAPNQEVFQRLAQIAKSHPPARLLVDLARDAALDAFRKQTVQVRRLVGELAKAKKKRDLLHHRLIEVLHDLATGPVVLPAPAGRPTATHEQLLAAFRELRSKSFPDLAGTLHARVGRADPAVFQRFLADEILIKGSRILVEHVIRNAGRPRTPKQEQEFTSQLRDHIAGKVCQGLARKVGYQMTPEGGQLLEQLLTPALAFLADLMTASPPGRLLIPLPGASFDPKRHEPIPGRPAEGQLKVTATLFPGYFVRGDPERVEEKAQVYTEQVGP
jgi:hypothetical protein